MPDGVSPPVHARDCQESVIEMEFSEVDWAQASASVEVVPETRGDSA